MGKRLQWRGMVVNASECGSSVGNVCGTPQALRRCRFDLVGVWLTQPARAVQKRFQHQSPLDPGEEIVGYYVLCWNVEVTFQEGRRRLELESQRQWSYQAIARTRAALVGLYSLVCLIAHRLTTAEPLCRRSKTDTARPK